ncbi:MAG TPA: hypothetical protein PK280_14180 [Planctomycetota bacterium]|nr:hypothetical protein [Planctomycetota bacterium]
MALPAAFLSSFIDPRTLPNLLHNPNGNSPLTLPRTAGGNPPANAVPNAEAAAGSPDSVELSDRMAPLSAGRLTADGSGLYRLVQAGRIQLSAGSLNIRTGAGAAGGNGRGAIDALNAALGGTTLAPGSGLMDRLRSSLEQLGLEDKSVRDLLAVAGMLEKLDPEAFRQFVDSVESFARASTGGSSSAGVAAPAQAASSAPAAPTGDAAASRFELSYVSMSVSVTEVTARSEASADGSTTEVTARRFELRFERLEISLSRQGAQGMQQGDPVVLDVAGDGTDLRETSDGVLFDLTGSGRPVQTAFVQGDDALLFYDANMNGLLDDGTELVGNRVPGLDGMAELASMDADGDGQVTPLDPLWQGLRVFQDWNGDGAAAPGEVRLLESLGIAGLSTLWERGDAEEGEGLRRAGTSSFTRADGSQGLMLDYYFGYRPAKAPGDET